MRIGIFGGTFDPLHNGHIFAIDYALENAILDKCLVVVSGDPWQKEYVVADAKTRLSWTIRVCEEFFGKNGKVMVDSREVNRQGPSYTIDTLDELNSEFPDDDLVLVVGEDIPSTMHSWKDIDKIHQMTEIFVVPREIVKISSTELRQRLAAGKEINGLISEIVEREIEEKALYNSVTS